MKTCGERYFSKNLALFIGITCRVKFNKQIFLYWINNLCFISWNGIIIRVGPTKSLKRLLTQLHIYDGRVLKKKPIKTARRRQPNKRRLVILSQLLVPSLLPLVLATSLRPNQAPVTALTHTCGRPAFQSPRVPFCCPGAYVGKAPSFFLKQFSQAFHWDF